MASLVYRDQLWVPRSSEFLQADIEIGLPESPGLAFNTGQDVALHSSLPGPCQQCAGRDAEICCGLTRGEPGLWDFRGTGNNRYGGTIQSLLLCCALQLASVSRLRRTRSAPEGFLQTKISLPRQQPKNQRFVVVNSLPLDGRRVAV